MPVIDTNIKKIAFPNGRTAALLLPAKDDTASEIVHALSLPAYKAVLLLIGGADNIDPKLELPLTGLFNMGISRALTEAGAILLDGGTLAGVMKLTGQMVANTDHLVPLIGVAPRDAVSYPGGPNAGTALEPNHSHFVLPEGKEWGSETRTMFGLLSALTRTALPPPKKGQEQPPASDLPAIIILVGGGSVSRQEMLQAVRHHWQVIVIKGSGGLADQLSAAWDTIDTAPPADPEIAEILEYGQLQFHSLTDPVKGLTRLIIRSLGYDKVLMQAWETFATYDYNAGLQQQRSNRIQKWIITLGFISTLLAVIRKVSTPAAVTAAAAKVTTTAPAAAGIARDSTSTPATSPFTFTGHYLYDTLGILLILLPIMLTILLTVVSRFKQGSKWLLLRAAAEMLKQEIYRYRTRIRHYGGAAQDTLAKKLSDINTRTMSTEVNSSALKRYVGSLPPGMDAAKGEDDGFSDLSPERYLEVRVGDQLTYFVDWKMPRLERQLKLFNWLIFIVGGLATFLAAMDQSIWLTVTTAFITALGTYLGYRQTESTLLKYNQTAANLSNIKAWWNALSAEDQSRQANIDMLVDHTEQTLRAEVDGWVQQMQNALAGLHKDDPGAPPDGKDAGGGGK
jgi:hypothetical protein